MLRSCLLLFLLTTTPLLGTEDLSVIIDKIDKLFRSDSSQAEMEMTIVTPHWERTLKMTAWSRGMEDTFVLIDAPKKDRGIATLRKGNEMWNYFPKIGKVIKVPPSMMMSSWMCSDFTNDDLVKETSLLDDYDAALLDNPDPQTLLISLKPKAQTVTVWGEIQLLINKDDYIPLEETYFDDNGTKIRVLTLTEVKELGKKRIPTHLEMVPLTKENHKTIVRYLEAQFDQGVPDSIFTLYNLKKKR